MIRRWRWSRVSTIRVVHLELPGTVLVARGLVSSQTPRIILVDCGLL